MILFKEDCTKSIPDFHSKKKKTEKIKDKFAVNLFTLIAVNNYCCKLTEMYDFKIFTFWNSWPPVLQLC